MHGADNFTESVHISVTEVSLLSAVFISDVLGC